MKMGKSLSTRLIHEGDGTFAKGFGQTPSYPETLPIYQTSVFSIDSAAALDSIYNNETDGYIYSRIAAPNADAVSEILAAVDSGEKALVFASGMAAITTTVLSFVSQGDHIISSPVLYGGVQDFFANDLKRFGIEVSFVDLLGDDVTSYVKPNTKLIYTETIGNPVFEVADIRVLSKIAHENGLLLLVDNTCASPVVAKPLTLGADVVLYSATKYLGGHSDIVGGAAVSNADLIGGIKRHLVLYGGIISPNDAWLLARSLRTLDLRIRKHSENALAVARFFESHPAVEKTLYPGLESSPSHERAKAQFENGLFGGMLSIDLKGGEIAANALLGGLETITLVPSLAGTATTVSWSAKSSHRFYSREERLKIGITDGQLRFSVGLEDARDIIAEISAALKRI
jgi:methionine-gamma-lyase